MTDAAIQTASGSQRVFLRRWPTWVAIGLAGLIALDMSEGTDLAPAVAASAIIYLGAATLRKPATAWAVFFQAVVVIFVSQALVGDEAGTWVLLLLAAPLVVYSVWVAATAARDAVLPSAIAMVGFGAAAGIALLASETVGAYLVAGGLVGHAIWDAYHYRVNKVVTRPYAELCLVLDALLALVIVIATVQG